MAAYKRIVVTGDVLRPASYSPSKLPTSSQKGNIRWLYTLIRRSLSQASGLPVEMVQWGEGFNTTEFYGLNNEVISVEGWGRLYNCEAPSLESALLVANTFRDSLVVGFELPKVLRNILSHFGIDWLNFAIHPVRCLDDLFLSCATSHPGIRKALAVLEHPLDAHEASVYALQAMYLRRPWPDLPRANTLFVGQVEHDSSVLLDGEFTNIATYVKRNSELTRDLAKWRDVLFKPHPVQNYDCGIYDIGLPFRYIHATNANIYQLLSMPWIERIITVSSSVGVEARMFDKEVTWLKGPFTKLNDKKIRADEETYFAVREEILWPSFWADLLNSVIPTHKCVAPRPSLPANAFRVSLNQAWGYPLTQMTAPYQSESG